MYGAGNEVQGNFIDNLVKLDLEHNTTSSWYQEGCYPGEPVFVARPDAADEDDGSYSRLCWMLRRPRPFC